MKAIVDFEKILRDDVTLNVEVIHARLRGRPTGGRARLWVAFQIIKVAVKIAGIGMKVNERVGVVIDWKDGNPGDFLIHPKMTKETEKTVVEAVKKMMKPRLDL